MVGKKENANSGIRFGFGKNWLEWGMQSIFIRKESKVGE